MKKLNMIATLGLLAAVLSACSTSSTRYYSETELAYSFVSRLNNVLGYDVEVEKIHTLQDGYIVVYDYEFFTYDAYYIGAYHPSQGISSYLAAYDFRTFIDLNPIGFDIFEDPVTGALFSEQGTVPRDGFSAAGDKQKTVVDRMASRLVKSYDISQKGAEKLSKAGIMAQAMNRRGLGDAAYSDMMLNVTGASLNDWNAAIDSPTPSAQDILIEGTAKSFGMSAADFKVVLDRHFN